MGKKDNKKKEEPPKDQFDGLALDVKNIRTAVLNLSSGEDEVLSRCCHSCFNFAIKAAENCIELMELGAVEHLRKLIIHADKLVRRHAGMALGIMSSVPKVRDYLAKNREGLIEDLTQLVQDEDNIVAEFAVNILANISLVYQLKDDLVQCGALPFLVKLLTSSDPDIKKHSLTTILSLASDFEIRAQLSELEAVHLILALITSEYPQIQQLSLRLATLLCLESAARDQVAESDDITNLLLFIENGSFSDLHPDALKCLCQCFVNADVLVQFKENGNLRRLIEAVKGNIETHLGEDTSICFAELICRLGSSSSNSESLRLFIDSNVIEIMSKMMNASDEAKIAAGHAIRVLGTEPSFRDQAADSGLTMKLISLISVEDVAVRREIVLSLAQLIQNHATNKGILLANKGVPTVVNLLVESDHDLVCGALMVLTFMETEVQTHSEAIEAGLINSLGMAMNCNDSAEIQQRVLQTITLYIKDSDTRTKLIETNILPQVISLLGSKDRNVRLGACSAIVNLCQDEATAQKMVDLGTLDILQQVNASGHLRSQCSEATFTQLLDYNLSAKLSLIGKLSQSNHIQDGFYDAGVLGCNSKFVPISELSEMEVNDKRPVLLVHYEDGEKDEGETQTPLNVDETPKKNEREASGKSQGSKGKKSSKKQKEKKEEMKIEEIHSKPSSLQMTNQTSNMSICESQSQLTDDNNQIDEQLVSTIERAKASIVATDGYESHVRLLAQLVADEMGGKINKNYISQSGYEMEIVEIKRARNSNIVPLGQIKIGLYRERALLFKLLCDMCGVPVTLEQGDYGRAWNCIILNNRPQVVDLMGDPGAFYTFGSKQSSEYLSL